MVGGGGKQSKAGALSKLGVQNSKVEHAAKKPEKPVGEQVEDFLFDKGIGGPSQKNAGSNVRPPIMRLSSHADEPTL